jgi:hypothetical protein
MELKGMSKVQDVQIKSVKLKGQEINASEQFNFTTPAEFIALMEENALGSKFVGVQSIDVVGDQAVFNNVIGDKG